MRGLWHEIAPLSTWLLGERTAPAVTAEYVQRAGWPVDVINTCHKGAVDGSGRGGARGVARVMEQSGMNQRLKVKFAPVLGPPSPGRLLEFCISEARLPASCTPSVTEAKVSVDTRTREISRRRDPGAGQDPRQSGWGTKPARGDAGPRVIC